MVETITPIERSGQSNIPQGSEQAHTLIVLVEDRPGAIDRVVGLMRRRRANMQALVIGPSELPEIVRVTVSVTDSEVAIEQLIEQIRKVVDVRRVMNLTLPQAITRELALIKINSTSEKSYEIIALGYSFGAHAVDITPETVTLEVTGDAEKIEKLISQLQPYGIREMARSGRVAIARGTEA